MAKPRLLLLREHDTRVLHEQSQQDQRELSEAIWNLAYVMVACRPRRRQKLAETKLDAAAPVGSGD